MFWYVQKLGPSACFRSYRRRLDKWWHTDITICLPLLSKDKSNLKKMREISDKIFWHGFSCKYREPFNSECQICFSFSLPHRWAKRFQKVRKKEEVRKWFQVPPPVTKQITPWTWNAVPENSVRICVRFHLRLLVPLERSGYISSRQTKMWKVARKASRRTRQTI